MKEALNLMRSAAKLLEKASARLSPDMNREDVSAPLHNAQICLQLALERASASQASPVTHRATHISQGSHHD